MVKRAKFVLNKYNLFVQCENCKLCSLLFCTRSLLLPSLYYSNYRVEYIRFVGFYYVPAHYHFINYEVRFLYVEHYLQTACQS